MKTKITLFFLLTLSLVNAQIPSFVTKKSLGDNMCGRHSTGMTSVNDKLYIYGGYPIPGVYDFTEYNPANGQLNKLIDFESPGSYDTSSRCLFTVQNTIYSLVDAVVLKYTFETNTWTAIPMNLGPGLSSNPDAGFVIGDIIYFTSATGNNFYSFNTITNVTTQLANYPSDPNRRGAFAFEINGKGYMGGGDVSGVACQTNLCSYRFDFYEYNPVDNMWSEKAPVPTRIQYGVGISHDGKGYAGLGLTLPTAPNNNQGVHMAWYEYDAISNVWTSKQNFMDAVSVNVGAVMWKSSISKIGNDFYVFGGQRNVSYLDEMYKYDTTTNTWSVVTYELGQNREGAMGFYSNGKIYIGGGIENEGLNDFWEYDLASNEWTQKTNFPVQYAQRACVELNGKGYFVGGMGGYMTPTQFVSNHTDELLEYDPMADVFTYKAPYPNGNTYGMTAFAYNGNLYAGLGLRDNGTFLSSFYKYDPLADSWTLMSPAPFFGVGCSSFILGNIGYVISTNNMVGKYNFDTNTWTTETHPFQIGGTVNQAFTYNGDAYINIDPGNTSPITLYKYNVSTSTWNSIQHLSFKNSNQALISTPSGVYHCFGGGQVSHPLKLPNTNDLRMLKFDAAVSDDYGSFETQTNEGYINPLICGTGTLFPGMSHTVYDEDGDLHTALIPTTSVIQSHCYNVTAVDLNVPFITAANNFANSFQENAMFLNKSITFNGNQSVNTGIFRIYFTLAELNKLVVDFNVQYADSKTLDDIKLVRYHNYSDGSGPNDSNPLNNTLPNTYYVYDSALNDYGQDKYFDIDTATGYAGGEIYAVLLSGQDLSNHEVAKNVLRIHPNPATNYLNIEFSEATSIEQIIIFDVTGKKILTTKDTVISVENLAQGLYIIEVTAGDNKMIQKFIKQ